VTYDGALWHFSFDTLCVCVCVQIWRPGSLPALQVSWLRHQHRPATRRQRLARPRCRHQDRPRPTAGQLPAARRWSEPAAQVSATSRLSWYPWWPEMKTARRQRPGRQRRPSGCRCTGLTGGSDEPAATATKYSLCALFCTCIISNRRRGLQPARMHRSLLNLIPRRHSQIQRV